MEEHRQPHVVIIGAGVQGCALAYFLSLRRVPCTVLERVGVAHAASGKAGGFLAQHWCDGGPMEHLAQLSFDLHADLAASLAGAARYGYRAVDTLTVSVDATAPDRSHRSSGKPNAVPGGARYPSHAILPDWINRRDVVQDVSCTGTTANTAQVRRNAWGKHGREIGTHAHTLQPVHAHGVSPRLLPPPPPRCTGSPVLVL